MKGFMKALPEILFVLVLAGLFFASCILAARSARVDSTGTKDSSGQKAPASTAQHRGESQGYLVTITDSGQYPDPEFKRLVEMERCMYMRGGEFCESIVGAGNPYDGFWEWTEVRQCLYRDQRVLQCRTFRPVKEKCYVFEVKPRREAKRRCTKDEEVGLIDLTLRLGDACEDVLEKETEPSRKHPGLLR